MGFARGCAGSFTRRFVKSLNVAWRQMRLAAPHSRDLMLGNLESVNAITELQECGWR